MVAQGVAQAGTGITPVLAWHLQSVGYIERTLQALVDRGATGNQCVAIGIAIIFHRPVDFASVGLVAQDEFDGVVDHREKAAEKTYYELGRIKKLKDKKKKAGKEMVIVVAGCVGQAEGEEVFKRAPCVDIVVGPQSYQTLPDLLQRVNRDKGNIINKYYKFKEV